MQAIYVSSNQFKVDTDKTGEFLAGRRVRALCGSEYQYSTVSSSTYSSPDTTITIEESIITSNLSEVHYGIVNIGDQGSFPNHSHDGDEGTGGELFLLTLSDTPTTYSGVVGKYLKTTSSGIEFSDDEIYVKSEVDTISGTLQTDIDTCAVSGGAEHNGFSDFVENEHIDHSGVTITAGTGLTGGGDITTTRTLDVDVGIADDKIVQIDDVDAESGDYAKLTASGIEGRNYVEVLSDISASSKTTAAWSKTIGAAGDYATWAAMLADMPDLIAHAVTVTIQAGTTLTESCELKNKHGITKDGAITIQAEKCFPTTGAIPTADSATATTLRDAALVTAALGNDYFNGCWVFIVDGTGTDNGFVLITDYVDATGDVVVASWPGTQPDNTSRYLIVGALFDGENTRKCYDLVSNSAEVTIKGIGFDNSDSHNAIYYCGNTTFYYCGIYDALHSGLQAVASKQIFMYYSGIVKNNTSNNSGHAGIMPAACNRLYLQRCGISDNSQRGIYVIQGSFCIAYQCFGDSNGLWGTYCSSSGQATITAPECSGSSGNHSDSGTAGNNNADQAAAY